MRSELPEVKVIAVPEHVQGYAQALRDCPFFERLTISLEDREKTKQYHEKCKRFELEHNSGSLEDFFVRSSRKWSLLAPHQIQSGALPS